ncbi:MAG: 50S ribosomal protein L11 methyltransferase [Halieaceae bacterium]|jgi:ribosomal protein L11 methyltransferase|nr:50S ribosomal protein L11 methyltransferase [Halieaceae bacterium]
MPWVQLRVDTHPAEVEALEQLLLDSGAVAITLEDNADQPVLEPAVGETPLWNQTRLTGLYDAEIDVSAVLATFPAALLKRINHRLEILEDKDWEREWMTHYQPLQFGPNLWVCPSWLEPPDPSATNLLLDPGLAFGTGTHPTTALCLTALASMPVKQKSVVDYGCGSGILGVAALKLGAAAVLAVDNDPQALVASTDNARRNNIPASALTVALPKAVDHKARAHTADIVVANILAGPLMELSDTLLGLLRPGGSLMLSGLIQSQAEPLCEHYAGRIELHVAGEKDGWVCLLGASTKARN